MVLGLKSKTRKRHSVEVDYIIHVQEIKPWPPSMSFESLLLHWENGDQSTGILTSGVEDGKIEFGMSFRLTVNLIKEGKSKSQVSFQKNCIEFNLHETRKDMTIKGQLVGSATVNIAEYGIMKDTSSIYVPLNLKKSFKSEVYQPVLFLKLEPYDKGNSSSLTNSSLVDEVLSEENYEDSEHASITDDDVDIHSARFSSDYDSSGSLHSHKEKNGSESANNKMGMLNGRPVSLTIPSGQDSTGKQISLRSDTLPVRRTGFATLGRKLITSNKLQHLKSVQIPFDTTKSTSLTGNGTLENEEMVLDNGQDANTSTSSSASHKKEKTGRKAELESRVQMLEEELREAAAIEIGLYSIVAEHGSYLNKVHAPARRLSRFYLHSCTANSPAKQASAARAVVSGLVLVSKACGNDVPRLSFWLSNSIVLRAIVSKAVEELPVSTGPLASSNGGDANVNKKFWLKKNKKEDKNNVEESLDNWEDPQTFTIALENIEAWIFSRVVESIWWQTLTPHMQSAAAKRSTRKTNIRRKGLNGQDHVNFSIDLWKKAFKDACERLCPIRAGGHECGCLPVLSRLVMEQLVNRLDVAMFNAILRDSREEMPTDPISDPISESKVLPVPVGKSSFGAGVHLKNAVGNWSRWLTDLFGIGECHEDESILHDGDVPEIDTSFKPFHLLNALSDLMMLPWEMLVDKSTRIEVCPSFSSSLIKRVLDNFVPDEFCPEPVPASIFYALDDEDDIEAECISSFPVTAKPLVYLPPQPASLVGFIGDAGTSNAFSMSGPLLKKSYTSDDELDELDSPISSIISGNNSVISAISPRPDWKPTSKGGRSVVRYKLLREVWTTERS